MSAKEIGNGVLQERITRHQGEKNGNVQPEERLDDSEAVKQQENANASGEQGIPPAGGCVGMPVSMGMPVSVGLAVIVLVIVKTLSHRSRTPAIGRG